MSIIVRNIPCRAVCSKYYPLPKVSQLRLCPPKSKSSSGQQGLTSLRDSNRKETGPCGCGAIIPSASDLVERSPVWLQPYMKLMRWDRPIGTWLLYLPCTWSIAMAAPAGALPDLQLLALFGAGSFLMRGAGCTINDMWDRDIDAKVERTKTRPLASGSLSYSHGMVCLATQLSLSLLILLQLNWLSVGMCTASLALVTAYPLMKRITYWPQMFLGFTFNYGILVGWAAAQSSLSVPVLLPLYMAGISWTLIYDTIYAHQDKSDDLLVGVRSTALLFGDEGTKKWLSMFSVAMVSSLALSGLAAGQTWPFYSAVGVAAAHLLNQIRTVDIGNPDDCLQKFKSNRNLGLVILGGIVVGNLLKEVDVV